VTVAVEKVDDDLLEIVMLRRHFSISIRYRCDNDKISRYRYRYDKRNKRSL